MRHAAALLLACATVSANDTLATLGAGGLVPAKSVAVRMESEDLSVSVGRISVKYVFRNTSDRDIDATVAFPLPELNGGDFTHEPTRLPSKDPLNFVGFRVSVAGKTVAASRELRALHEGRDVTARLREAGLPVSVADPGFEAAVKKLSPARLAALEKDELLVKEETWWWPNWTTRVQFYWVQRFPARSTVEVEHTYRPVAGGGYIVKSGDGASSVKPYCGGADALERIRKWKERKPAARDDEPVLYEKQVRYILTTARNWSGPIGKFRLTVTADSAGDIVLTCFPGLRQTAPGRYELSRTEFVPDRELDVMVLQARR